MVIAVLVNYITRYVRCPAEPKGSLQGIVDENDFTKVIDMFPYVGVLNHDISMYGIASLLGIAVGAAVILVRAKYAGLPRDDVFYAFLFAIIGLLIGAKLLYIVTVMPRLWEMRNVIVRDLSLLMPLFTGGFVFYGGLAGSVLGVFIYCRKYNIPTLKMLDASILALPIAHAFGRIGCLLAGCCYGMHYEGPFALRFPEGSAAPPGVSLFPSQLMEAMVNFAISFILLVLSKRKNPNGTLAVSYALMYAPLRFVLEFFRGDAVRGILLSLSTSQWLSILTVVMVIYLVITVKTRTFTNKTDR